MSEPRWLLLAHQLPTRLSNARVKTWRRLQQLGAAPSRNSVYGVHGDDTVLLEQGIGLFEALAHSFQAT